MGKPTFKEGFTFGWILAIFALVFYYTTSFKEIVAIILVVVYAFGFFIELWRAFEGKSLINPEKDGLIAGIVYFAGLISFILHGIGFP